MIIVSREEMQRAEEDPDHSIEMYDRDGYPASLGVFHELHCIVRE